MTQWEYRVVQFSQKPDETELNRLGADGWKVAKMVVDAWANYTIILKRPKQP
jgi:hypothetical protein